MEKWKHFSEVTFDENLAFHVDTRDFCVAINDYIPKRLRGETRGKLRKNPKEYIHSKEEIKALLQRYYDESGGAGEWRMFNLTGIASHRAGNWKLKYIRIYKLEDGYVIYSEEEAFLYGKTLLACPVDQKYLNHH